MNSDEILEIVDQQTWLDSLGKPLAKAITSLYQAGGTAGLKIRDFIHGVWLGHPLHPMITDVPIGAWTAAVTMDAMEMATGRPEFGVGADAAITVGAVSAAGAAIAGLTDWQHTVGETQRLGTLHGLLNVAALGFYAGSLVMRSKRNRQAGWGLALLGFTLIGASGYLGGELVFKKKIGVNHAPDEGLPKKYTAVLDDQELAEGQVKRVEANNLPLLLARIDGKVYALADTCAHLGGPLSEGELAYEPDTGEACIRCPWHGSTFRLKDGHIVMGPSTYTQPWLEVRVRNEKIEVRAAREAQAE